jgi:hypothetical protein
MAMKSAEDMDSLTSGLVGIIFGGVKMGWKEMA